MIIDIKVPSPGESITEVQIAKWLKGDGDYVEKDEELAEVDSDKATLALVAEDSGTLSIKIKEGETVQVGAVACTIDTEGAPSQQVKESKTEPEPVESKKPSEPVTNKKEEESRDYAVDTPSPSAGKLMAEHKISPDQVKPSGKGGRITKGDVLATISEPPTKKQENTPETTPSKRDGLRAQHKEKMSMLRKKLSQRLVAVKNETAMLTTFNEVDMSAVIDIRKKYKDKFKEAHGIGLGFMSFFTKAVCVALGESPTLNAMIDGDEIIFHDYCDIGIAVSAPKGLMVPVIRNAESLSLAQIEIEILKLASKARDGKLTIDEMTGGTFTITNGGVFGSMLSTPIINPPQSAILGMHNIVERPVAIRGKVEIRPVMYVALSYDHRIIDGKDSVGFLVKVKSMLEDPVKMMHKGNDPMKLLLEV